MMNRHIVRFATPIGGTSYLSRRTGRGSSTNCQNFCLFSTTFRGKRNNDVHYKYYSLSHTFNHRTSLRSLLNVTHGKKSHSRQYLSSTNDESSHDSKKQLTGEECYNLSLELYRKYEEMQEQIDKQNSIDQYEAMIEMSSKDPATDEKNRNSIRQSNIAVVKTIAKQTREKKSKHVETKYSSTVDSYRQEADKYMQYAAFVHGHTKAIVKLANDILDQVAQSNNDENCNSISLKEKLFSYIMINSNMKTIIDLDTIIETKLTYVDVAKSLYQEAINRGDSAALYNLAHMLWNESEEEDGGGELSEATILKKVDSLQMFHRAAHEFHDMDALYFLGVQYMGLLGAEADNNLLSKVFDCVLNDQKVTSNQKLRQYGYEMIHQACEQGHAGAAYYLSLLHRNGDNDLSISPSISSFQKFLNSACDGDFVDSDALYLRAHCIFHKEDGYGESSTSLKESYLEFIKAGEAGNPNGFISAGAMLHQGYGEQIPRDRRKAFELYQLAAELGSVEGWRNVAACYALGHGIPQCESTAQYITKTMLNKERDSQK